MKMDDDWVPPILEMYTVYHKVTRWRAPELCLSVDEWSIDTSTRLYGGFHKWGYPKFAGWFISWKIPAKNGWWWLCWLMQWMKRTTSPIHQQSIWHSGDDQQQSLAIICDGKLTLTMVFASIPGYEMFNAGVMFHKCLEVHKTHVWVTLIVL